MGSPLNHKEGGKPAGPLTLGDESTADANDESLESHPEEFQATKAREMEN